MGKKNLEWFLNFQFSCQSSFLLTGASDLSKVRTVRLVSWEQLCWVYFPRGCRATCGKWRTLCIIKYIKLQKTYFYMEFVQIKQHVKWHIGGAGKSILLSLESSRLPVFHVKLISCWIYIYQCYIKCIHLYIIPRKKAYVLCSVMVHVLFKY